jgi:hypothetical protein
MGPTLLRWMEENASHSYNRIIDADKKSIERFNGQGNALAQS